MTSEKNTVVSEYVTYPRKFLSYKWYKPILVGLLLFFFYLLFTFVVLFFGMGASIIEEGSTQAFNEVTAVSGYDGVNVYNAPGVVTNMGGVAIILVCLWLASKVVKDRPFSSYSSSRGGWNMKIFLKCFGVSLLVSALPIFIIYYFTATRYGVIQFTPMGFLLLFLLVPFQCIAEEYLFRGLLLQGIGSWIKIPIVAIIVQTALFALAHPYILLGKIEIFLTGLCFGKMAWMTHGLEASSAIHITNNLTIFLLTGFGIGKVSSYTDVMSLISTVLMDVAYIAILYYLKKKGTFEVIQKDDVTLFNNKIIEKQKKKEAIS